MAEAVDEKLRKKLSNFQVNHHDTLVSYYKEKMEWWRLQTDVEKQRCKVCWLRIHQCYCETLRKKREVYTSWEPKPNASVCMYYNAVEIARSANTAHVLEATCPHLVYSIIQGDLDKEKQLMDEIEREFRENDPQTCIMFPSKDAKLLSEWMAARPVRESSAPVCLVMLDGTFPGAARIAKYMINCCALRGIPAPLVKLDLEGDACKSAVAGMMYQPGKDKICTYQATVMALQQAGVDAKLCESLHGDLRDWIGYILSSKVKLGKSKPRNSMKYVMDVSPSDIVAEKLKQVQSQGVRSDKHTSHQSNHHKKNRTSNSTPITNSTATTTLTATPALVSRNLVAVAADVMVTAAQCLASPLYEKNVRLQRTRRYSVLCKASS